MVVVSAYMGGTRGSGILSSACDVREMSVVIGVGGVCDMCMERGGRCWGESIVFRLYESRRNMGKVGSVFWLQWRGWCRG